MPHLIKSPVSRRTREEYRVLFASANKAKPIVVSIMPGDILRFRELRGRSHWDIAIDCAFRYAVKLHALAEAGERGRKKQERKRQVKRK